MKKILIPALAVLLLAACKKTTITPPPTPHPQMQYLHLHDESIRFGQIKKIDINSDGTDDFLVSTLLVGDPILERDRRQYYISSSTESRFLQDGNNQSPILNKGDQVMLQHPGYGWFEVTSLLLAEKIVPMIGNSFWQGAWKQANQHYLPVQVKKNGSIFNGWIALSFDTMQEKIILHKAAICTEAGKTIKAGF
ncbi:MAG TPA: lipoprotein [Ferruginibacter sp.]|nr:lipoprotein [Ferruginibacter sp.]